MRSALLLLICSVLSISTFLPTAVQCQQNSSSSQSLDETALEGTVVSSTRDVLVVRTDDNQFQLFTYDHYSSRVKSAVSGARVRVVAAPGDENGARVARSVTVLEAKPAETSSAGTQAAPVPPKVRDMENDIKREARRWRLGVQAGAAFDPELLMFGVHSQMGPILHSGVFFRPNAEFAFGEVTDLVALNLEMVYRIPAASRRGNWTPYVGAGPALNFIHQNFEKGRQIDFGNFDYDTGFNVLAGVQYRKGTFIELKTSLYSGPAPKLRLIFGYNF
jgi:opacity protein-like surface antigen